jgi:hypothetical protein
VARSAWDVCGNTTIPYITAERPARPCPSPALLCQTSLHTEPYGCLSQHPARLRRSTTALRSALEGEVAPWHCAASLLPPCYDLQAQLWTSIPVALAVSNYIATHSPLPSESDILGGRITPYSDGKEAFPVVSIVYRVCLPVLGEQHLSPLGPTLATRSPSVGSPTRATGSKDICQLLCSLLPPMHQWGHPRTAPVSEYNGL